MKARRLWFTILALLAISTSLRAQTADAGYRQWQSAYDAADQRVGGTGALREALSAAASERSRMQALAQSCSERAGRMESAASRLKFLQNDYESAQRDADHFAELRDQRYEELYAALQSKQAVEAADLLAREERLSARRPPHETESQRLDDWKLRLQTWSANLDAWFARVDSMSKEEGPAYDAYLAAFYEYRADLLRYNDDVELCSAAIKIWNAANEQLYQDTLALGADSAAKTDEWVAQLLAIEEFMLEEGKPALEAQDRASKKQLEWAEAAEKFAELEQEQAEELAELDGLLSAANAMLSVVIEALSAPPPTAVSIAASAAEPYALRTAESAQAVAVAPPAAGAAPAIQNRIMILPPADPSVDPAIASAERIRAQLQAEALAGQYAPVTEVPTEPVAAVTDSGRTPTASLGPAPVSTTQPYDDGSAVIVLDEEMLAMAFDPRVFISDQEYQRALEVQARYAGLPPKLEAEIARLRMQREKTVGYSAEFEAVRAEIACGALRDALGLYSAAFKYARTSGKLSKLSNQQSETIERAFDLMKMGLTPAHVELTPEEREKRNLEFKTLEEGTAMLVEVMAASSGNPDVEAILGGAGNAMKSYGEIHRYWTNPERAKQPVWEQIGGGVKAGLEASANFVPVIAFGVAVEAVGERGAQWWITRDAVNSLSASLQSTDEAIIYLSDQLTRRQLELDKAAATIENYQAVDPNRRRAFHIRAPEPPVAGIR